MRYHECFEDKDIKNFFIRRFSLYGYQYLRSSALRTFHCSGDGGHIVFGVDPVGVGVGGVGVAFCLHYIS